MADDKKAPATEEHSAPEATSPETLGGVSAQPAVETVTVEQTHTPVDNVIPFGGAGTDLPAPGEEDTQEPWEKTQDELNAEQKKPRRGRPPKAAEQTGLEGEKKPEEKATRKGRPPKADKVAPDKATPDKAEKPVRDKVSQSKKAPAKGGPDKVAPPAPRAGAARSRQYPPPRGTGAGCLSETGRAPCVPYIPGSSLSGAGR